MYTKILIADDEEDIVFLLKHFLEGKGYVVLTAYDGREALRQLEKQPDIILLDISMPYMDGIEVCKRIREHVSVPIVFLTAKVTEDDKVKGFGAGGDDYIIKPFSLKELEARIAAHLRREKRDNNASRVKFFEELSIDYSQRKVFFKDTEIPFAKKDFGIIELLSQNRKQIFDKERIYECVWGCESEGNSTVVPEHIRKIRMTFLKYTGSEYVETIWGCGYKWKNGRG